MEVTSTARSDNPSNIKQTAKVIIFNHENFCALPDKVRKGTDKDVETLKTTLSAMGIGFKLFEDFKKTEIFSELQDVYNTVTPDTSCVIIFILTHGDITNLQAYDGFYNTEDLWLKAEDSEAIKGKEKIYFIQACRGNKEDEGVLVESVQTDGPTNEQNVQLCKNLLVVFSSSPEHKSYRRKEKGSRFIQTLCPLLKTFASKDDLMSILTRVNYEVATKYPEYHFRGKKQMPFVMSTCTRKLYLTELFPHLMDEN